jgi:small subunit ribosomal protein S2
LGWRRPEFETNAKISAAPLTMSDKMLVPREKYIERGVQIGTKVVTKEMRDYIYRQKGEVKFINIEATDERLKVMAKILSKYNKVAVVASRVYAIPAAQKFCEIVGAKPILGRFKPGTFTNPSLEEFYEPEIVLVADPRVEKQAIIEATKIGVPTVALVDTDNTFRYLDYFVPCNNKGKKSLPFIFYLLAREILKFRNEIKSDSEFKHTVEEFELKEEESGEVEKEGEHEVIESAE